MNRNIIKAIEILLLLIASVSAVVSATNGLKISSTRMEGPLEAIEVCKDKKVGFTIPLGEEMKATCKQINGELIAVPGKRRSSWKEQK